MKTLRNLLAFLAITITALAQSGGAGAIAISQPPPSSGPGSGDVVGPASSTDNAIVRWDGATGKLIKDTSNLTYTGTTLSTADGFTVSSAGSIGLTAGGTNQNITLTPSGTGQVLVSGGGAPQLARGGDTDTGISWPGANQLNINVGGASYMSFAAVAANTVTINGTSTLEWGQTARAKIGVSADTTAGNLVLTNTTTGGTQIQSATVKAFFGEDSADGYMKMAFLPTATAASSTNYLLAYNGGQVAYYNVPHASGVYEFQRDGGTSVRISGGSSPFVQLGGTTSSFPALKRVSATLAVRLADDSADAGITVSSISTTATTAVSVAADGFTSTKSAPFTLTSNNNQNLALVATGASVISLNGGTAFVPQALSGAGAVNVTTTATFLTTTGVADALTLANGTAEGQIKTIVHKVDGGSAVLTPTTALGFTTVTFTSAGESVTLQWTSAGWVILSVRGAVVA